MNTIEIINNKIYEIRNQKVMLDFDLAELYEIETKALKQSVRRNLDRFPSDFMFELTKEEFETLRSQIVTPKRGGTRYLPFAFTEQGVAMLSSVLNNEKAIAINIAIMRSFVSLRKFALTYDELTKRLTEIENQFPDIYKALNFLMDNNQKKLEKENRKKIGYKKD